MCCPVKDIVFGTIQNYDTTGFPPGHRIGAESLGAMTPLPEGKPEFFMMSKKWMRILFIRNVCL